MLVVLCVFALSPPKAFAATNGKITYMQSGDDNPAIWVMDADGSNKTQLTTEGNNAYPAFSPNGNNITYTHLVGESYLFSTINPDGTSNNVTDIGGLYTKWLPNSTKVAPYSFETGTVIVMNPDGTEIQNTGYSPFFENGLAFAYDFSPDSTRFVSPVQDGEDVKIQVSDLDGSNSSVISTLPFGVAPNFSADGNTIYFIGSTDNSNFSLYSVDIDGSNETVLQALPGGSEPQALSISPDRTKLLFITQGDTEETFDIYIMDINGSNQVELFDGVGSGVTSGIGWSPDSAKLVFSDTGEGGIGDIFTINADGTGLTNLTNTPDEEEFTFLGQSWGAAPESSEPESDSGDQDNISDTIENAAPNNGDANNDGTPDSEQSNVASFVDPVSDEYAVLEVSDECSITAVSIDSESSAHADPDFSYPTGLMDFTLDCGTPGTTATVTQYYYGQDSSDFIVRKYNPDTKTYTTIDGAELSQETIDSSTVTKATYQVKDGSSLDLDGTTDGNIHDPSGLAQTTDTLANTGQNTHRFELIAGALISIGYAIIIYIQVRKKLNV
jgi:Tol biopolymer transport system component